MAAIFANQLQPWEENQSPSPTEERTDPFSALQRARSGGSHKTPPSPASPINSLHRQLSGDPDNPPPAWQRRSSFRDGKNPSRSPSKQGASTSSASVSPPLAQGQGGGVNGQMPNQPAPPNAAQNAHGHAHGRSSRSPSDASSASVGSGTVRPNLPPQTKRHPHLTMTTSTPGLMGNDLYSHDSPRGSSSSLHDPVLLPPNPAFAGKGRGSRSASARSSMHTLNSMTSEELWNVEPDMSNPTRPSAERPLDTVRHDARRNSQLSTRNSIRSQLTTPAYQMDMMWPIAPPELEEIAMGGKRSKSTTNVQSLSRRSSRLTLSRKKRQSTADVPAAAQPPSKANSILNSSANSSLTDIPGQKVHRNPSYASLNGRPPSAFLYNSRDFLTQMAPLEGGYAIAAAINTPSSQGNSPVASPIDSRHRGEAIRNSRPPVSRSAGMARWSLDGGEHYGNRSFGPSSAASTTSNLAAPPINSNQPSPESEDVSSVSMHSLPDGASPPVGALSSAPMSANTSMDHSPPLPMPSSIPVNPSPLSQSVTKEQPISKSGTQSTIHADQDGTVAPAPVPSAGVNTTERSNLPAGAATPTTGVQGAATPSAAATPSSKEATASNAQTSKPVKLSAKDAKAAEKAQKAEAAKKAKEAEEKRRQDWEKAQKARAELKAKEKEDKKRAKKEKGGLGGLFGLGGGKKVENKVAAAPVQSQQQQQRSSVPPTATQQQQQQPQRQAPKPAAAVAVPARHSTPESAGAAPSTPTTQQTPAQASPRQIKPFPTARISSQNPATARPASQLIPPAAASGAEPRQRNAGSMPSDIRAPQPVPAAASADSRKDEKKKLGFFGTIRRRFSSNPSTATVNTVKKAEQQPPVPPMPANAGSLRGPTAAGASEPAPAPRAAPAAASTPVTPMTPPKTQAVAKAIPQTSTPDAAPMAQADLPPRSTSVRGSPANVAPAMLDASSAQHTPQSASSDNTSNNGIATSPSPLSRTRGSLKGPRPMPRPASAASASRSVRSTSVSASASASSPKAEAEQATSNSSSFPFHKPSADHVALIGMPAHNEHAGTESSGLSQVPSHFTSSDGTEGYDPLDTPPTSEEAAGEARMRGEVRIQGQDGSEVVEAENLGSGLGHVTGVKALGPARDGSGDTVRAIVA